jgi:arylsulfatase A-like enzyme
LGKPNIIIIYCDDLGYGDLGCYGSDAIRTPHLDHLANDGVRFTNWYSNSPVCSPSRASLLTGRYPAKTGINQILSGKRGTAGLSVEEKTIAARLKEHGYRTAIFGKWHLGVRKENEPNAHGFDEAFGFLAGCVDYYSHIYYWDRGNPEHDLWHNGKEIWLNGEYLTEVLTDKTVEYIGASEDEPFFIYVPFNAPHYPMHAPQKYVDRYPDLPPDRRIMAAMISAVDDGVGAIVEALKQAGKYEDTIIFFSSDNGPSTEARNYLDGTEDLYYGGSAGIFRGHKGSLFDGGLREPAIMSYPAGIQGGQVSDELGAMIDVLPTLLELADLPAVSEGEIDGLSIAPVVKEGKSSSRNRVFWRYNEQLAVRNGRWKLVKNGKLDFTREAADSVHLSDLNVDPGERINLKDQHPDIVRELDELLNQWLVETEGGPAR